MLAASAAAAPPAKNENEDDAGIKNTVGEVWTADDAAMPLAGRCPCWPWVEPHGSQPATAVAIPPFLAAICRPWPMDGYPQTATAVAAQLQPWLATRQSATAMGGPLQLLSAAHGPWPASHSHDTVIVIMIMISVMIVIR